MNSCATLVMGCIKSFATPNHKHALQTNPGVVDLASLLQVQHCFSICSIVALCFSNDIEHCTNRTLAIASSLATIMSKIFNVKSSRNANFLDRCPMFLSDKKSKLFGKNIKKIPLKGHNFELKQFTHLTMCNFTKGTIWGIGPQGYACQSE